jgi:hypothetical protein
MVDFGIDELGQFGVLRIGYCFAKCSYERGFPRPGDTEGNLAFVRCVAECSSPVPLPDREDEDDEDSR